MTITKVKINNYSQTRGLVSMYVRLLTFSFFGLIDSNFYASHALHGRIYFFIIEIEEVEILAVSF